MYSGVDRFTQGELRPPLPSKYKAPVMAFAAREVGTAIVAELLRKEGGRIEEVERVSIQPRGMSLSRTLFARGSDEDYMVMTRGKLLDRIKVRTPGLSLCVCLSFCLLGCS
jgi:ATP-dependent Zn protease